MKKQDNEEENILDNDDNADMKNQEDDLFDNDKKKERDDESPMGVGRWVGSLILLEIPIVNIVFFCMWFFGMGNRNRVQYVRANFIVLLIKIIIISVVVIILMSTLAAFFDQLKEFINSLG